MRGQSSLGPRRFGTLRVCSGMTRVGSSSPGGGAGSSPPPSIKPRMASDSWASFCGSFSAFLPKSPRLRRSFSSRRCVYSFLYSSRSRCAFCNASSRANDSTIDEATRSLTSNECRIADQLSSRDERIANIFPTPRARTASQQLRQLPRIELHRHTAAGRRQVEHCAVKPLVEQAVTVAVKPQRLEPGRVAIGENKDRACLRILTELALHQLRQPVKPLAHVDELSAHEDANCCRNHAFSRIASSERSCCASKPSGMCKRRPRTSSSKRACEARLLISTNGKLATPAARDTGAFRVATGF